MDVRHEVLALAAPLVEELGFDLVDVEFVQSGRWTLRVYIDRTVGDAGVSIDDCSRVSRRLDDALEMNQTVPHHFVLEVSSPGIERRLRTADHFRRVLGARVFVQTHDLVNGRRRVEGELAAATDDEITIVLEDGGRWSAPLLAIQKAHLVVDPWARIRADGKRNAATADPPRALAPDGRKETE